MSAASIVEQKQALIFKHELTYIQQLNSWSDPPGVRPVSPRQYADHLNRYYRPSLIEEIQNNPSKYFDGKSLLIDQLVRLALEKIPKIECRLLSEMLQNIQVHFKASPTPLEEIKRRLRFTARHISSNVGHLTTPLETIALRQMFANSIRRIPLFSKKSMDAWLLSLTTCIDQLTVFPKETVDQDTYFDFLIYSVMFILQPPQAPNEKDLIQLIIRYANSKHIACNTDKSDTIRYLLRLKEQLISFSNFELPEEAILQAWLTRSFEGICEPLTHHLPMLSTELEDLQNSYHGYAEDELVKNLLSRCKTVIKQAAFIKNFKDGDLLALINFALRAYTVDESMQIFLSQEFYYWQIIYAGSDRPVEDTGLDVFSNIKETLITLAKEKKRLESPEKIQSEIDALQLAIHTWLSNYDLYLCYRNSVGESINTISRNPTPQESPRGISGGGSIHERHIRNLRHAFAHTPSPPQFATAAYTHQWHHDHSIQNTSQRLVSWIISELFSSTICTEQEEILLRVEKLFYGRYRTLPFDRDFANSAIFKALHLPMSPRSSSSTTAHLS